MKAKELQLGDYVDYRGRIIKVTSLYDKGGSNEVGWGIKEDTWVNADNVMPIPLEKIHLTKNGFKAREYTDDTEFYYYDCYEINVSFDEGISEENIPPIIFLTIEFAEKSIAMPIEYVHELQQAMRIMGCDKEIKL